MTQLRLADGRVIQVRPITDPRVVMKMMAPFAHMAKRPPEDPAAQAHMTAAIAIALSRHLSGISEGELADHLTVYPLDAPRVTKAVLGDWVEKR